MTVKTKWTRAYIASIRRDDCTDNGQLNDFGFAHIHNHYDRNTPKEGTNTVTYLAHVTGASRPAVTRALKLPYSGKHCPSKRPKPPGPKISKEKIEAINKRREWIEDLVERTVTVVRRCARPSTSSAAWLC